MLHRTVWDAPSASSKKKLVLNQKQNKDMLHRTEWDAPSASSKKEGSFKPETVSGYVTSNCMGHAVRQFEKEACLGLGTGARKCHIELYGTRRAPVR